ncbi:MAG TPA: FTR1 family protein [Thermoanaerobaculia bacterium]|nr:FTR1 family protein [Thermoanaerobaculia bacterium]
MLQAWIIVFRESFEAFLCVAVIVAYLVKTGRSALRPAVMAGVVAAVVASVVLGWQLQQMNQPLWEGIIALVAAALVITFVVQVWRTGRQMKVQIESGIERRAARGPLAWLAVFGFTFVMVCREGMETALMLIQVRQGRFWLGCAAGIASAAVLAMLWARYGHRIDLRRFFEVTGLFLILFSVQIVFYAIHEFSEAEILPNSAWIHSATEPFSADGRYSLWVLAGMIAICALWLVIRRGSRAMIPAVDL